MYTKQATIVNETGLHARPASDFCRKAKGFQSAITIKNPDSGAPAVNAKSVVMVLTLGAGKGAHVEISAQGDDEQAAVDALAAFIDSGLGE